MSNCCCNVKFSGSREKVPYVPVRDKENELAKVVQCDFSKSQRLCFLREPYLRVEERLDPVDCN